MALTGKQHTIIGRKVNGQQAYIVQNNLILPYQFLDLPVLDGITKWTELAPPGWSQYGPYYNLFLKYYLRRDGSVETIPNGGGNVHSIKCASFGSTLGLSKAINITTNTLSNQSIDIGNWSAPRITYEINIPANKNYVRFGAFCRVNSDDPLRSLNFGAISLHFKVNDVSSYLNYALIHGGGVNLLGNSSSYTYFNTYNVLKTYEAYYQWIGRPIIKVKKLNQINQSSIFNEWQYLNFEVPIPTFSYAAPDGDDNTNGKATSCTLSLYFGENNSYLNDGSGTQTGSVIFYYPYLNLI